MTPFLYTLLKLSLLGSLLTGLLLYLVILYPLRRPVQGGKPPLQQLQQLGGGHDGQHSLFPPVPI